MSKKTSIFLSAGICLVLTLVVFGPAPELAVFLFLAACAFSLWGFTASSAPPLAGQPHKHEVPPPYSSDIPLRASAKRAQAQPPTSQPAAPPRTRPTPTPTLGHSLWCRICGTENRSQDMYCKSCGRALKASAPLSSVRTPQVTRNLQSQIEKKQPASPPSRPQSASAPVPPFQNTSQSQASPPQTGMRQVPAQTPKAKPALSKEGSLIGREVKTGEMVSLPQAERRKGLYVIGKNGTGKTTFLVHVMLQDIQAGMGLCFLDPHGDAITDILLRLPAERKKDVILLDVMDTKYPFGLNLYECTDPADLELAARTCEQVMHIFEKVWGSESKNPSWGPAMEDLLRNTALTLIYHQGYTMAELPLLLTDEEARNKITATIRSTQLRLFWQQFAKRKDKNEYMASTLNKVRAFLSNPIVEHIVGQSATTIDFRRIMDEGKILLVKLPGRYEDITSLVGAVIIGQLLNAALSRVDLPESKRRQFNLYADEYQRFATPDFASLLAEARKFAIATTIAHQFREQLDSANRGATLNAANMVVFRISGEDGEELAKEFNATPPPPEIIGQRPILTPKNTPLKHLLEQGHSNPGYTDFVSHYALMAIEVAGWKFDKPQGSPIGQAIAGDSLVANLAGGLAQMRANKQYTDTVILQAEVGGALKLIDRLLYEVMRDRDPHKPLPADVLVTFAKMMDQVKLYQFYDLINPKLKEHQTTIDLLCSPDSASWEEVRMHATRGLSGKKLAKAEEQFTGAMKFVQSLRKLMGILARDPIMVDSGQHEPIYDKPRTYADVQNQIATELANLPPFTAKAKLGHTEVVIQSFPLTAGISDTEVQQRLTTIVGSTRAMYCKPRLEVEEEIATRQEKLITLEPRQQRTVQEGEV